ncbi:hypothetical protein BN1012_Phect2621 [Candidatus Phaeomarinobacter ectocarpi]|uniref:GapR-like DNA-binding domain-containing protein n=1 Tax=Candidatus Phaeomarinibacter ectocarpi TaxID=1458461 RepID=X5MGY1_9HYPH|nr:GapR family DNA-binding domain-containing protein [Candidatus Phaeomarinobacter ectocarpi]CDO60834.1 hypothetical protein BN1012_Phect2621 [Candidatus Phaeomarinobacter ectocarpi]
MVAKQGHNSGAEGQLRALVSRVERIEEEITGLNADKADVYREARGMGFDVKALRQCMSERKQDPEAFHERRSIVDLYHSILRGKSGTAVATRVRTREGGDT